jgi:hypothetical protein
VSAHFILTGVPWAQRYERIINATDRRSDINKRLWTNIKNLDYFLSANDEYITQILMSKTQIKLLLTYKNGFTIQVLIHRVRRII